MNLFLTKWKDWYYFSKICDDDLNDKKFYKCQGEIYILGITFIFSYKNNIKEKLRKIIFFFINEEEYIYIYVILLKYYFILLVLLLIYFPLNIFITSYLIIFYHKLFENAKQ